MSKATLYNPNGNVTEIDVNSFDEVKKIVGADRIEIAAFDEAIFFMYAAHNRHPYAAVTEMRELLKSDAPNAVAKANDIAQAIAKAWGRPVIMAMRPVTWFEDPSWPRDTEGWDQPRWHRLRRNGELDLSFKGWLIGAGEFALGEDRGISAEIYLTTGGSIVASITRWHDSNGLTRTRYAAKPFSEPAEALAWLKEDAGGVLGEASKAAWEEACDTWAPMGHQAVETIT